MKKYLEDALQPFTATDRQLLLTIYSRLNEYGAGVDEAVAYIRNEIGELKKTIIKNRTLSISNDVLKTPTVLACPVCGNKLEITPINNKRCNQVGGDWRSLIACTVDSCPYNELSKKSRAEILQGGIS